MKPKKSLEQTPNHSERFNQAIRELETLDFLNAESKMLILVTASNAKPASEITIHKIPASKVDGAKKKLESIMSRLGLVFANTSSDIARFDPNENIMNLGYVLASSQENFDRLRHAFEENRSINPEDNRMGDALGYPSAAINYFIEQARKGILNIHQRSNLPADIPDEERRFMMFVPSEQYFTSGEQDHVRHIIEVTRQLSPTIYGEVIAENRTSVLEQLNRERRARSTL